MSTSRLLRNALPAFLALLVVGLALLLPAPVQADAGRYLKSESYIELTAEIDKLQQNAKVGGTRAQGAELQQRLADLQALQKAIAASDDRSQVSNKSSHSIGVFGRYKKEPASNPAYFYVLGPGHSTDDDYELVGVYVPADVSLSWEAEGGAKAASTPRIARLLEGQQLKVTDSTAATAPVVAEPAKAAPASVSGVSYQFSLPVFALDTSSKAVSTLPSFSQAALDLELESAPLD